MHKIKIAIPSKMFLKLSIFNSYKKNEQIVRKCYLKALEREPDQVGLNHFISMMQSLSKFNGINEDKLIKILENSEEGKKIKLAKIYDSKPEYILKGLYNIQYIIRQNSALDNIIVKNGIFNKWLCMKLKKLIGNNSVIFDVGANVGLLSLPFAKLCVPLGKVFSFEPDQEIVKQLKKNVHVNKLTNISIEEFALQDNSNINKLTLYINRTVQDNGLRNDGLSTIEKNSIYKITNKLVKASTIDRFVKEKNINKLDFIKVDVEGSEYKVLKGAEQTIIKFRPIIYYEHTPSINKSSINRNIEKSFLYIKKLGYKQYLIDKNTENNLIEMVNYTTGFDKDGDIICFQKTQLPASL